MTVSSLGTHAASVPARRAIVPAAWKTGRDAILMGRRPLMRCAGSTVLPGDRLRHRVGGPTHPVPGNKSQGEFMPSSVWTGVLELDPTFEYVVMATRFEVRTRRQLLGIMRTTQQLWQSLPITVGLVGYRFTVSPLEGTLSTLTAWRDQPSLEEFVRGPLHALLATGTRPLMKASLFAQWAALGADLPPTWATANDRLDASRAS